MLLRRGAGAWLVPIACWIEVKPASRARWASPVWIRCGQNGPPYTNPVYACTRVAPAVMRSETLGHLGDARYAAGDVAEARADWRSHS